MEIFNDLLKKNNYQQTIGVAMANDEDVIVAIGKAQQQQLATFVLYGPAWQIKILLKKYALNKVKINDCANEIICLQKMTHDIKNNKINVVMKGLISTKKIMQMILHQDNHLIENGHLLSHVAILKLSNYHKPLFLTDAAINIAPTINQKIQIINNALELMDSFKYTNPHIALLCAVEKVSLKMVATVEAQTIVNLPLAIWKSACKIIGPVSLDVALNKKAANIKQINHEIAGDIDLLVAPNIESGNILYKSLVYFGDAIAMGIVLGAKIPIILTSRADSSQNKLLSIALALWFNAYQLLKKSLVI